MKREGMGSRVENESGAEFKERDGMGERGRDRNGNENERRGRRRRTRPSHEKTKLGEGWDGRSG